MLHHIAKAIGIDDIKDGLLINHTKYRTAWKQSYYISYFLYIYILV